MYFLDASVIVAILKPEADAETWVSRLEQLGGPFFVSPLVRMEAMLAVTRAKADAIPQGKRSLPQIMVAAAAAVDQFIDALDAHDMAITPAVGAFAKDESIRYGKVAGHPARLNMGDVFAYGCAKSAGLSLVYKGDDFTQTDLA
ncbi:type II toxin-antitoxin system VapC family toxin [Affinirhizobium pseudoryzae]|uniref:type II toxin-antitoxin system VapC family toxin n=1 Tax=Allorhizobium pseudoryzae TaxID=379684 RepID=UPI0013EDEBBC|nr:type II toxin-antitoxin system VapC family toxin [Allorhizobium pseudoryzae]